MILDLSSITEDLIRLIKSSHMSEAQKLIQNAHRTGLATSFCERQKTVRQISLMIFEAKKQRSRILGALAILPAEDQLFARPRIEQMCCAMFDQQISELNSRKRQLSRALQTS